MNYGRGSISDWVLAEVISNVFGPVRTRRTEDNIRVERGRECPICGRKRVNIYLRDKEWKCKQCWDLEELK